MYLIREHSKYVYEYNEHLLAKSAHVLLWAVLWMSQRTKLFRKFTKKKKLIKLWKSSTVFILSVQWYTQYELE